MEAIKRILSLFLWAAMLLAQHIVCFDFFDTGFWYQYLLAAIFAAAQFALLYASKKRRSVPLICGLLYSAVGILKVPVTLFLAVLGDCGLSLLCVVLDLTGAAWSFWLFGTAKKSNPV